MNTQMCNKSDQCVTNPIDFFLPTCNVYNYSTFSTAPRAAASTRSARAQRSRRCTWHQQICCCVGFCPRLISDAHENTRGQRCGSFEKDFDLHFESDLDRWLVSTRTMKEVSAATCSATIVYHSPNQRSTSSQDSGHLLSGARECSWDAVC